MNLAQECIHGSRNLTEDDESLYCNKSLEFAWYPLQALKLAKSQQSVCRGCAERDTWPPVFARLDASYDLGAELAVLFSEPIHWDDEAHSLLYNKRCTLNTDGCMYTYAGLNRRLAGQC